MPADAGAPILDVEIAELERVLPVVWKYLQPEGQKILEGIGVSERQSDGSITIPAIRGRDCVFVTYDAGSDIALCGIEKAFNAGEITGFPKPISCHLYPIRIYPVKNTDHFEIVYEEIPECKGGRSRGKKERIPLLDFLASPLVRAIGESRLKRLREIVQM
jgi:hypothetical protein